MASVNTLTPFDVVKYRNNQPVKTRDGRVILNMKELFIPELNETYLTAVVNLKPVVWNLQGKRDYIYDTEDALDLFMDTAVVYKWAAKSNILSVDPNNYSLYDMIQVIPVA